MNYLTLLLWALYGLVFVMLARYAKGNDALLPGRVGVVVQAFAYFATYVSAVALVGFSGLGYYIGMQVQIVAMGVMWFGVWFVYRYLAWPTRVLQRRLEAKTPLEIFSKGYSSKGLGRYLGVLTSILIIIYCSAVFKGAALILSSALPLTESQSLWILVGLVGLSVLWGGLRGVLYTEAMQGLIMALGVITLVYGALKVLGGPGEALTALAQLPPTPKADNGYLALSSGAAGMNTIFLCLITSVGVWAQPQLMQRHFALKSRQEAQRIIPLAMLVVGVALGGAFFVGGVSRLLLGDGVASADDVIPALVKMLLPEAGRQFFAMAIVSASLSTASALLHVTSAALGQDVLGKSFSKRNWRITVLICALLSGVFAAKSSSIIAIVCSTSWTLIAGAMWIPYIALLIGGPGLDKRYAWAASLAGTIGSLLWYALGYTPTSIDISGIAAPGLIGGLHPLLIGILSSGLGFACGMASKSFSDWRSIELADNTTT